MSYTSKTRAKRITLNYFQASHPFRKWKRALSIIVPAIGAAWIVFAAVSGDEAIYNSGPISTAHAMFENRCTECHVTGSGAAGQATARGWYWKQVTFEAAIGDNDMSTQCLDCHTFGGPAASPHNITYPKAKSVRRTECTMCHTEHKGREADISALSDEQCATCHERSFSSFDKEHPEFSKTFPHSRRVSIRFDHAAHFGKHFEDRRVADKSPTSCITCHQGVSADRIVEPLGFEENCAYCHAEQIVKRDFIVLRLPALEESILDQDALQEVCGLQSEEAGEKFESVSADEMSEAAAYLLGVAGNDAAEYGETFKTLVIAMAKEGSGPLAAMIEKSNAGGDPARLFAGLNPEAVKRMACAWAANLEYELPGKPVFGGWYGDLLELIYRPSGHADPVIMRWLEFAVAAGGEDEDARNRAKVMRESLISPKEGPGACTKCHAVSRESEDAPLRMEWRYRRGTASSYRSYYSHRRHLKLVNPQGVKLADPTRGCATCHRIDLKADFSAGFLDFDPMNFSSNFAPITKEACTQCHSAGRFRQDCQLCHSYHKEPNLTERVTRNET